MNIQTVPSIHADSHSVREEFLIPFFSDVSVRILCDEKDVTDQYFREGYPHVICIGSITVDKKGVY